MTDHAEREKAARQEVVNAAWAMAEADAKLHGEFASACERHDKALDALVAAVLASARERVEAVRESDHARDCSSHNEIGDSRERHCCDCKLSKDGWNAALDAAARAITEAT